MQQCYDWQSNVLKFTDVNGNKYNLKFRGNKTIVHGDSATGKSLLCTMLKATSTIIIMLALSRIMLTIFLLYQRIIRTSFPYKG